MRDRDYLPNDFTPKAKRGASLIDLTNLTAKWVDAEGNERRDEDGNIRVPQRRGRTVRERRKQQDRLSRRTARDAWKGFKKVKS